MPLPDRNTIKTALVSLVRDRGTVSPSEVYAALADTWRLSVDERAKVRGGRRLYEHEIRWARQELVIEGVLQKTRSTGKGTWKLSVPLPSNENLSVDNALLTMVEGFLDPDKWFLSDWLPRYEE